MLVLICVYISIVNDLETKSIINPNQKTHIAYGRGALFRSILPDMTGIEERSERKRCRSDNNLNYYCWAYGEELYDCHQ
jgi:hypothetical protein